VKLLNRIKDYFFGPLLFEEMGALERASANVVYYELALSISLVTIFEISFCLSPNILPVQHLLTFVILIVFTGALYLVRWTKSIGVSVILMLV
jgi:hypothetical protein